MLILYSLYANFMFYLHYKNQGFACYIFHHFIKKLFRSFHVCQVHDFEHDFLNRDLFSDSKQKFNLFVLNRKF